MKNKSLLWFSCFAGIVTYLVFFLLGVLQAVFQALSRTGSEAAGHPVVFWLGLGALIGSGCLFFLYYCLLTGVVFSVYARLQGTPVSVRESFSKAAGSLRSTFCWVVVLIFEFLLLEAILYMVTDEPINTVASVSWIILNAVLTVFVVPVMVFERKGLVTAIEESWSIVKRIWRETVTGLGILTLVSLAILYAVMIPATVFLSRNSWGVTESLGLFYIGILAVAVTVYSIFITGLYSYAKTGSTADIFLENPG